MQPAKLSKLIKNKTPQEIIYLHCNLKIDLTDKQLDYILKLRKKGALKNWRETNGR